MSKEHSEPDTRLTPSKKIKTKSFNPVLERTQQALEHYKVLKKDLLTRQKEIFLQKQNQAKQQDRKNKQLMPEPPKIKNKKPKMLQKPIRKSQRNNPFRRYYKQQSLSSSKKSPRKSLPQYRQQQKRNSAHKQQSEKKSESEKDNSFIQEQIAGQTYQLMPVHEALLQFQQIVDEYITYQFHSRKLRSVQLAVMYDFLKTCKFSLNSKEYFRYLNKYNKELYELNQKRIACKQVSKQQMQKRVSQTRKNMTQIYIKQLLI